jgi:cytochrome c oxidase subunit 3
LFTTTFFTLTGFHGLHVTAGLIALSILLGLGLRALAQEGKFRPPSFAALDALSLYWHFVDGVWIIIFSVVYLTVVFS